MICNMNFQNTKPNHIFFSSQPHEDLVDHDYSCLISFQQENLTTDLLQNVPVVDNKGKGVANNPTSSARKRGGSLPSKGGDENEEIQKKIVHRENERQRRKEMTKLYASLRDLLPVVLIKGNRSASDHMHQAVHYIKQMGESVKDLRTKREQLKNFSYNNENSTSNLPNTVSVSFSKGGVEILINSCSIEDRFVLSGVLKILVEEGLDVISCTSTKVKDRLLHSIQTEACDLALIDSSMLHQRLARVANTQPNSC